MAERTAYITIRVPPAIKSKVIAIAKRERRTVSSVVAILLERSLKGGKMSQFMARQGDVLLRKIDKLPDGKRKKRFSGQILEGESTGHVHRIADVEAAEVLEIADGLYVSVGEQGVSIIHEEHAPIDLPPGNYEVLRQREYAPEAIRNVMD